MYKSDLHDIFLRTLHDLKWTRSTKDEDNFRQVVCAALYKYISPNNVEIPSTRSGHGDIKIFGRKIELKYASNEKTEKLDDILDDFDLLLDSKIEFSIVSIKLDTIHTDAYLHRSIACPMLAKTGANANFGDHGTAPNTYKGISIFLAATYPHKITPVTLRNQKGKNSTAYLSIEDTSAIFKSSFLETPKGIIHVDVIGNKSDGLISFLYKRASNIKFEDKPNTTFSVEIPYNQNNIKIADGRFVDAYLIGEKLATQTFFQAKNVLEKEIPCFKI